MFNNFLKPGLGNQYQEARDIIINGVDITIDSIYIQEAIAFVEGYHASTANPLPSDYVDVLIGNAWEEVVDLINNKSKFHCSSLMSWGDATAGTNLDGKSVITSHLDTYPIDATLLASHVIVVHFPSEPNSQPWLAANVAGIMTPKYGCNRYFGIFFQDMSDYNEPVFHGQGYQPVGYALRKAAESFDYNEDQEHNVMDVKAALDDCMNGFGTSVILSVLSATKSNDSLTAMICEIASNAPTHTYRFNTYPDSIPGDNLYTANDQIARNNSMHFCNRYNKIVNHIGDGTMIGIEENWNLMKNYSLQYINFQVKQYAPEADLLKMAVMNQVNIPAAKTEPYLFSLDELFTQPNPVGTEHHYQVEKIKYPDITVIPNPVSSSATIEYHLIENEKVSLVLFNHIGQEIQIIDNEFQAKGRNSVRWDATDLPAGIYFYRLTAGNDVGGGKIVKL